LLLLPAVQREGKQHFGRVLSCGGLKSTVGLELDILTRLVPVLARLA